MVDFDDYPYSQIRAAGSTLFGRLIVLAAAFILGAMIGVISSADSWAEIRDNIIEIPLIIVSSLLFGRGLIVFPVMLVLAVLFIRWEWPLWIAIVVTLLMWWNTHKTLQFVTFSDPIDRAMKKYDADKKKANEQREARRALDEGKAEN